MTADESLEARAMAQDVEATCENCGHGHHSSTCPEVTYYLQANGFARCGCRVCDCEKCIAADALDEVSDG